MGLTVRDIMQVDVRSVHPALRISDLERDFAHARGSGFPVVQDGQLVGVVSRTDILRRFAAERTVHEALSDYYGEARTEVGAGGGSEVESISAVIGKQIEQLSVADVMAPSPIVTHPGAALAEVAELLIEHRIHRVPVVERGHLVGIVTTTDLVRLIADRRV